MDCSVCCETFKCDSPKIVTCGNRDCGYKACRSCNQMYLKSKEAMEPHCMSCKSGWSQYFVVTNLTRTWFENDYRQVRNKVVVDTEVSRLPESMQEATVLKQQIKYKKIHKDALDAYLQTDKMLRNEQAKTGVDWNLTKINELTKRLAELRTDLVEAARPLAPTSNNNKPLEEKKFVMACVFADCKGFLNKDYFCDLCDRSTCKHCLCGVEGEHECNKEDKETADEIRKTTRPCPTCGERIFKISGCDQMYCTQCYTAFSWRTGNVETGNIHNPHFFQIRRANNGVVPRNPNDVLCGGVPDWNAFENDMSAFSRGIVRYYQNPTNYKSRTVEWRNEMSLKSTIRLAIHTEQMSSIHQIIGHVTGVDLPRQRIRSRDLSSCNDLRVDYLVDRLTKSRFESAVIARHLKKRKTDDVLQLYELLSVVGVEFLRDVYESSFEIHHASQKIFNDYFTMMSQKMTNFLRVVTYINHHFMVLSVSYNCSLIQIKMPGSYSSKPEVEKERMQELGRCYRRIVSHRLNQNKQIVTNDSSYYEEIDWTDSEKSVRDVIVNVWGYKKLSSFKFARFNQKAKMCDVKKIGVV